MVTWTCLDLTSPGRQVCCHQFPFAQLQFVGPGVLPLQASVLFLQSVIQQKLVSDDLSSSSYLLYITWMKTRRPWTLALCLTPATGVTNGNFLQTYFIVTYGLAPLQDIRLRDLTNLEFDLSRSFKVTCDDVIGLSIYSFLLMFNSNLWLCSFTKYKASKSEWP